MMQPDDLHQALEALGLHVAELARLVDVTPRAVALWLSGERHIPGPLSAYVRLLSAIPIEDRRAELGRIFEFRALVRNNGESRRIAGVDE
jgi:transcriptional regulator with XRE-family HTH domain